MQRLPCHHVREAQALPFWKGPRAAATAEALVQSRGEAVDELRGGDSAVSDITTCPPSKLCGKLCARRWPCTAHTRPVQPRDRLPTMLLSDPGRWRAEAVHRQAQVPIFTKRRLEDVSSHSRSQGPSPSTLTPLCLKYKAVFIVA